MHGKFGNQPNQSVIDGINVLQALAGSDEPVGTRALARRLGLEPTKTNRLLKTLASLGIAQQLDNRKYTAGPGMHVLAAQSLHASGLLRRLIEPLERPSIYNYVVALGVLWRDAVSYIYHRQPGMSSNDAIGRIGLREATDSGVGMALLSTYDDDWVRALYDSAPIPRFPEGIDALLEALATIRTKGYAWVKVEPERPLFPERIHHTVALANQGQSRFAIGLSGWIPESVIEQLVDALRNSVGAIDSARKSAMNSNRRQSSGI